MNIIDIIEWASQRSRTIFELPNYSLQSQLDKYEQAETGIGFVLFLQLISTDTESDNPEATHTTVISVPVMKIRGRWQTVTNENVADMMSGLIRMVVPPEEDDEPSAANQQPQP